MNNQTCDSCGSQAPSFGPDSAGNWVTDKGADGWGTAQLVIYRESQSPEYIKLRPGQAFYAQVASKVQLCDKCIGSMLVAYGLEKRIATQVEAAGDFVTLPRSAIDELKRRAGNG